ncbi:endonuclease/exonuclease/phosphatase family protein [Sporocytophaga myxococcoides]|uniref:endonuclease/exonuclease/phosphatase family protein n=1 Tax=Sporocytophaga myxococcoides TaxID=153721 RepID=UPI00042934D1|nr:endonuclease/exonuclease/phosphatase family protein [Sporocytophaga myxococcoides]
MTQITIATFNCENLFRRFKFDKGVNSATTKTEGFIIDPKKFDIIIDAERAATAAAIKETKADIIALQEIENMDALKQFNNQFLSKAGYKYKAVIDGNDPRFIDVAILSKVPFDAIRTHQFLRTSNNKSYIFSRDCLEVEFNIESKPLTLFVNHLKSMMEGREVTSQRRRVQAEAVIDILKKKYGSNPGNHNWIVLGDMNDYKPSPALDIFFENKWMVDVLERLPENERWTHFYDKKKEYRQIDYILLSKKLATDNKESIPRVIRKGLSKKAKLYTGKRFDMITDKVTASDHCPVAMSIEL